MHGNTNGLARDGLHVVGRGLRAIGVCCCLSLFALAALAETARLRFEGRPFDVWDVVQLDAGGVLHTFQTRDDDGDGIATLVADIDPNEPVAGMPMMDDPILIAVEAVTQSSSTPLMTTLSGESLISVLLRSPGPAPRLGEELLVRNGLIDGFLGRVAVNPGLSMEEILRMDLASFQPFDGVATVVALSSIAAIPEPSTLVLIAIGTAMLIGRRSRACQVQLGDQ